jgi:Na+-transporting NADH:ubiquinone oxidoreductase subunit NqrF
MYTLTIRGDASCKIIKIINIEVINTKISLMDFLISENLPIASSCKGEGVCQKCTVNDRLVSCQISLQAFLQLDPAPIVSVSYL